MSKETCEQRIGEHLASRESYVNTMQEIANGEFDVDDLSPHANELDLTADVDDIIEEAQEALYSLPLEISTSTTLKVLISTGGPEDYLTATIESTRHASTNLYGEDDGRGWTSWERSSNVVYHFADWFDHAERVLDDDSPLVAWFDSIVEVYGE